MTRIINPKVCLKVLTVSSVAALGLVWLNWFNAELSSKKYLQGPSSQEVEEEGGYT